MSLTSSCNAPTRQISVALSSKSSDTLPPVIQLIGSNPASANLVQAKTNVSGENGYADPGAVAIDETDGNLTAKISVKGFVDTFKTGSYILNYEVTDKANNKATIKRIVNVVAKLDPLSIPKYMTPLLIPWAMPKSTNPDKNSDADYYEIAVKQFKQQILPKGFPTTTVWGYGSASDPDALFNSPSLTIEATANKPVKIKWINSLIDSNGNYLPHILPVDQTLHWADPFNNSMDSDMNSSAKSQTSYVGPVPIVTHLHGAHVSQESDGYPESWYLPDAKNISEKIALFGKAKA